MTETSRPIDPNDVDELLSADLDGELDAAAHDLGYDPAEVRAAIDASPEMTARRDALGRARAELARDTTLDEVTAARLRTTAMAGVPNRQPKRARLFATGGAAAAVIVIVVAAVAVARPNHENAKVAESASAGATAPRRSAAGTGGSATLAGVDFGAVPNVETLAARVGDLATAKAAPAADVPTSTHSQNTSLDAAPAPSTTTFEFGSPVESAPAAACFVEARRLGGGNSATLLVSGRATLAGRAVTVSLFARGGKANVLVVLDVDCKVVDTRTVANSPR